MKASKILLSAGLAIVAVSTAQATVRETFNFSGLPSDGGSATAPTAGSASFTSTGGYQLGRIDVTGSLRSTGIGSWGSEARIRVTRPGGGFVELQPFPSVGSTFTTLSLSGSFFTGAGSNPAGGWGIKTFESFDDAGGVDAFWDSLQFKFTDEPPVPPAGVTDLGALPVGSTMASGALSASNRVQWYKFTTGAAASTGLGTFLDIDSEGSALVASNDTEIGLYDSFGTLVGTDDDDGSGLLSQLTFGAGTRPPAPPTGGGSLGMPYDGRDGSLPAGTYYLAIASFNSAFGDGFAITPGTDDTGSFKININTTAVPAPGTLALVAVGGLFARRRRA